MIRHFKAIDTQYKGHLFRSRLEARWAVYFDAINVNWTYESEGYELSNGQRYLPDFYFPDYGFYGEVKPNEAMADFSRMEQFVIDINKPIVILAGLPKSGPFKLITIDMMNAVDYDVLIFADLVKKKYGTFFSTNGETFDDYFRSQINEATGKRFEF